MYTKHLTETGFLLKIKWADQQHEAFVLKKNVVIVINPCKNAGTWGKMGNINHEKHNTDKHPVASSVHCDTSEAALIIQYVIICSRSVHSPGAGPASAWSAAVFNNKTLHFLCHFGRSCMFTLFLQPEWSHLAKGNDA